MKTPEEKTVRKSDALSNYRTDRRKTIGAGAAAILSAAGMVAAGKPVFAQDATPASGGDDVLPGSGQITLDPSTVTDPDLATVPPEMEEFANDWPMWQHDYAATRNAVGSTIDSSNVGDLGVAWELKLMASSPFGAITSNPIVLGDRIYIIDNSASVQCLDRESGEVIWAHEQDVSTLGPNGVAVGYGILVGVTGDTAEVFALDAETGEELWRFALSNHNAIGITTSPVIYDGWVLVSTEPGGNTKGTYRGGANGVVYCMDVTNGATLWTWDTVEDDLWGNFRINSGGGLWYPISVDTNTGLIYAGVGNAAPFPGTPDHPEGSSRPGPNDYANCLVCIDPKLGKVLWYQNVHPRDLYDHDNQLTPVLGTVEQGNSTADLVFTSGKHGYIAAYHRGSGQEVWRRAVGKHQNDGLIDLPDEPIEVYPGIQGGNGAPMAFANGVLYAAILNWPNELTATTLSADFSKLSEATTELIALDGTTGDYLWNVELPAGTNGPGPTIANDVVFIGTLDGIARGFNTADGSEVWRSQTSAGLNAPFAIAGDMMLVPSGSVIAPSPDSPDPLPSVHTSLIAYKIGAAGEPTLGEPGANEVAATPQEDTDTLVHVNAVDIAFEPNALSIKADTDVTISVTNMGVLQHDFLIQDTDIDSDLIDPGETVEVVVNLPAGEYTYFCSISGHLQAGMVGTLTVA